jgi:hypothetical protein
MTRLKRRLLLVVFLIAAWGGWQLSLALRKGEGAHRSASEAPTSAPPVRGNPLPSAEPIAPATSTPAVAPKVREHPDPSVALTAAADADQRAVAQAIPDVPPAVVVPDMPSPPAPAPSLEPARAAARVSAPVVLAAEPTVVRESAEWRPPLPERFSLTIRSGSFQPRGAGDLFATFSTALTLAPEDLRAQSIGVDWSWLMTQHWELVAAIEGSSTSAVSQTQAPRPGGGLPVQQSTSFQLEPVGTVAIRYYLVPPFRWNGKSWVSEPSRFFLGGGLGMLAYTLRQEGEFLDEGHARTFLSDLESRGLGRIAFLTAGIEVPLFARLGGLVEARYQFSDAPLAAGFAAFERIDLSGLRLSIGIQRRW